MSPAEWLTALGLSFDLVGVLLIGVAAAIQQRAVPRWFGSLTPRERRAATVTALFGWALLFVGFAGQLIGVLLR